VTDIEWPLRMLYPDLSEDEAANFAHQWAVIRDAFDAGQFDEFWRDQLFAALERRIWRAVGVLEPDDIAWTES